jgi:hypothetical protein
MSTINKYSETTVITFFPNDVNTIQIPSALLRMIRDFCQFDHINRNISDHVKLFPL